LSDAERLDVEKYLFEKYLDPALEAASERRGLTGEYFTDPSMKEMRERRIDPRPDFQWSAGINPVAVPQGARVSWVRWTGTLEPARSGTYTLSLAATGQAKLWIEEKLVIEVAGGDGGPIHGKPLALEVGKPVRIRLEASPKIADSHIHLQWSGPNLPIEVIPQDRFRPR
jgi:alpha-L-fucosidase